MPRTALLLACVALAACASPRWVNPQKPNADLQADLVACEKDAERLARLSQIANSGAGRDGCAAGQACSRLAENQSIQTAAEALSAHKRCMAARGWRQ